MCSDNSDNTRPPSNGVREQCDMKQGTALRRAPPKLGTPQSTGSMEKRHVGRSPAATGSSRLEKEPQD